MKVKLSLWVIVLAVAGIGYYLWNRERQARVAADARAADLAAHPINQDPVSAAQASADATLANANKLIASIRADPGVGAALGLAGDTINRIIYKPDAYANIAGIPGTPNQTHFFDWHTDPFVTQ